MKTLGQIAYEAHQEDDEFAHVRWDDLPAHARSHWEIIAEAVVNTFRQRAILR